MRQHILGRTALLFSAALLLLGAGCAEKTDCAKLTERMTTCSEPLWETLEPTLKGRNLEAYRNHRNRAHADYCRRIKGVYKQSAKINKCIKIEDCKQFSECFCRAVKKASECGRPQ